MANKNPFMPNVNEYYDVDPTGNPFNMYYGKTNQPVTDFSSELGSISGRSDPFGYGFQDIDYSGAVYSSGGPRRIPLTGDQGFDMGLKLAIESNDRNRVIDYLRNAPDKDRALAVENYVLDELNSRDYSRSRAVEPQGDMQGSASSIQSQFQDNPFAKIMAEVLGAFRG